jgi:apolipoprotein N-acyltransferase
VSGLEQRWRAPALRVAAVLLSGGLYGVAFLPLRLQCAAWIALVPLLLALRGARAGGTLGLMWLWALVASYSSGHWLPGAVETYYLQPVWVGWLFFFGISSANAAPYYLPLGLALRRLAPRGEGRWTYSWVVAAAWVTAELARGRLLNELGVFISNPWAQLGYSQVGHDTLLQVASLSGIYGVTFALVAVNATVADLVLCAFRGELRRAPSLAVAGAGVTPALLALAWGSVALARAAEPGVGVGDPASVAVVQGNLRRDARWRSELYGSNLEIDLELTLQALQSGRTDLVVWPESAMSFFLETEPRFRRSIGRVLGVAGAELLAGGPRLGGSQESPRYYNTIFAIGPDGEIRGHYDKEKLVPFGEYFPLRTIEFLRRRFEQVRFFAPGAPDALLPTRLGPAAVAICNEAMLPELVARRVRAGGGFILNPSNDVWAPEPVFAEQMLDMAIVRAVEQRRWLVRASTTGPSALVDPWGRVLSRTSLGERGWIRGTIAPRQQRTVYGRLGDLFAIGCGVATAVLLVRAPRPRVSAFR